MPRKIIDLLKKEIVLMKEDIKKGISVLNERVGGLERDFKELKIDHTFGLMATVSHVYSPCCITCDVLVGDLQRSEGDCTARHAPKVLHISLLHIVHILNN